MSVPTEAELPAEGGDVFNGEGAEADATQSPVGPLEDTEREALVPGYAVPRPELDDTEEICGLEGTALSLLDGSVVRESVGANGFPPRMMRWHEPGRTTPLGILDGRKVAAKVRQYVTATGRVLAGQGGEVATRTDLALLEAVRLGRYPTVLPETHCGILTGVTIPQAAHDSLVALGQSVDNAYEHGCGDYNIDEYSMILDRMPPDYPTPEKFLAAYLRSPNKMANDARFSWTRPGSVIKDFDTFCGFQLKQAGTHEDWSDPSAAPGVGDWYHIKIPGNDGDVVVIHADIGERRCSATVATITDGQVGPMANHPVAGRRQFGIEQLETGGYRVYTRGFDRQRSVLMDVQPGNWAQHQTWQNLFSALAHEHGGRCEDPERPNDWGWSRQLPKKLLRCTLMPLPDSPSPSPGQDLAA